MTPEYWQQVKETFHSALERAPEQRAVFLAEACRGHDSLRREVEALIFAHEQTDLFIDAPAFQAAAEMLADGQQFKPGETLSHYEIHSVLGEGGMGRVYLADDRKLKRKVALKVLPVAGSDAKEARRRLLREAQSAAALDHPNICAIYEVDESSDSCYIAMQYVEGETLEARIEKGRLSLDDSLNIAAQIAGALCEAHAHGISHRDVKPSNVMLSSRGQVKVLDFGLAKTASAALISPDKAQTESLLTAPGLVLGTVPYMSPEQLCGKPVDARTDIFSFGAVLYEMLSGRRAFARASDAETIGAILHERTPELSSVDSGIPKALEDVVEKCLTKDACERYQTMEQVARDLNAARSDAITADVSDTHTGNAEVDDTNRRVAVLTDAGTSRTASGVGHLVSGVRRHGRGVMLAAAGAIILAAALGYYFYSAQLKLSGEEKGRLTKPETENAEARKLYQQGDYYLRKNTDEATLESGKYFKQAIEKDPNFALAYVGLAKYYSMMAGFGNMRPNEAWPISEEAAGRALVLDETLSGAHSALANVKMWYDWDWSGAERELKRAIELNPEGDVRGLHNRLLEVTGRIDEAIADASVEWNEPSGSRLQRAERLPKLLSLAGRYSEALEGWRKILEKETNRRGMAHLNIGETYAKQGRYEEALAEMLEVRPRIRYPRELARIGYVYAVAGKRGEAMKILDQMKRLTGERYNLGTHIAAIYAALGNKDEALAWLTKACDEHEQGVVDLKVDPRLDTLRGDPRFVDLLRRVKLAQ